MSALATYQIVSRGRGYAIVAAESSDRALWLALSPTFQNVELTGHGTARCAGQVWEAVLLFRGVPPQPMPQWVYPTGPES